MPRFLPRNEQQIRRSITNATVVRSGLSDVTDTSGILGAIRGISAEIAESNYQIGRALAQTDLNQAAGTDLDELAKVILPRILFRLGPRRGVGKAVFTRTGAGTETVPVGTTIQTDSGIVAVTTSPVVATGTNTATSAVTIVAVQPGEEGNVEVGAFTRISGSAGSFVSVTNTTPLVGGRDFESDDDFRARLLSFVASLSRSTVVALEALVIGLVDEVSNKEVRYAKVVEDFFNRGDVTLYIDDGGGTAAETTSVAAENVTLGLLGPPPDSAVGGEEYLSLDYRPIDIDQAITFTSSSGRLVRLDTEVSLNPASGALFFNPALGSAEVITADYFRFINLIQLIQKYVDGDPLDPVNFPGWRAAGVRIRVLPPLVRAVPVAAVLTVEEGFSRASVIQAAKDAVLSYINTLGISNDIVRHRLIDIIMDIPGVLDLTMSEPQVNVAMLDNELPRNSVSDVDID